MIRTQDERSVYSFFARDERSVEAEIKLCYRSRERRRSHREQHVSMEVRKCVSVEHSDVARGAQCLREVIIESSENGVHRV